jgi:hypothetical protein
MRTGNMFRVFAAVFAMSFSMAVLADQPTNIEEIVKQQREIRAQIEADEYDLSPRERRQVFKDQERVFEMAEGHSSVDDLNPNEQVEFRNAIERVAAAIADTRAERDDREICWRERQSGSKIMKTVCGTQGEIADLRRGAREYMSAPRTCVPPGCGQ